jgi:hypothetical protein
MSSLVGVATQEAYFCASDCFPENRDLLAALCQVPKLLYRKISFPFFLLTILDAPWGYRFLARRRVRSSPFLADRAGFEPAAYRSSRANAYTNLTFYGLTFVSIPG